MLNMAAIIEKINKDGQSLMSSVLSDLIHDHRPQHDHMLANYKRYKASKDPDGVPVFNRHIEQDTKVDRKLNDAFDADVVDVKTGYMMGNPVIYALDKSDYTNDAGVFDKAKYDLDFKVVKEFNARNGAEDIDGETLKMASICGYSARLLWNNVAGTASIMNVPPWEAIFVRDGSLNEAQYAMRYYELDIHDKKYTYVEWYDALNISYYISSDSIDKQGPKDTIVFKPYDKPVELHMFKDIPLIQFVNNEELQGDCDKVYALIDAYDFTSSDISSEIEQFRLAYMFFGGMAPDKTTRDEAKKTGIFGLPDPDSKVGFITKDMNDDAIEHHLERLEKNIYRFAKSVNFSDEAFAGNISGIAMKFKMFGLESKCIISERKFTAALRTQYMVLSTYWAVKQSPIDYMKITYTWTRNFPLNLLDEAETTAKLKGLVSEETRLGLLSFIDDPLKEIEKMERENAGMVDLDGPELDIDGNPIEPAGMPNSEA